MTEQKTPEKPARNSIEIYRLGTLVSMSLACLTFIVLFIFILVNDVSFAYAEATDMIFGLVVMVFALLFAVAYIASLRAAVLKLQREAKSKEARPA